MRKENRKILSLLLLFLTLIASLLPCGKGILFRARVSLLTCSNSVLGLLSICYLAWTLSFFEFIIYKRAVFSASTYLLWKELLLCIFILSWYGMGDIFERIDDFCCGNHQTQCPMISLTSKSQSWISSGEFTRELDKESLLN